MQSSLGLNRSHLRNTAAFLVLFLGAVLITIAAGSLLLHELYSWPWRPRALGLVLVALIGFSCLPYIAPGTRWATFRENLIWSLFLTSFAACSIVLLRIPRALTQVDLLVLSLSAPFVAFATIYSWRRRHR